jgi:hypothetical protein
VGGGTADLLIADLYCCWAMSSPDLWRSEVLFSCSFLFILVYILGSMGARLIPGGGQQIVLLMNHLIKPTGFPFGSFKSLYLLGQSSVPFALTRVAHIAPRVTGDNNLLGEVNTSFITSFGIYSTSFPKEGGRKMSIDEQPSGSWSYQ